MESEKAREEYKKKFLMFREKFNDFLWEVNRWESYIYQQESAENLYKWIERHIEKVDFELDLLEKGYSTAKHCEEWCANFSIYLRHIEKAFKKGQEKEDKFIAPR